MSISCADDHRGPATPPQLTVEVTHRPGATVIALAGELDLCTSELLPPLLDEPVPGTAEVIVDAAGVQFLDVRGWRDLHSVIDRFRRRGHRTSIVNSSPQVDRLTRLLEDVEHRLVGVTMSSDTTTRPLACRFGGCRWRYRNQGPLLVQECARRCGTSASHRFRREGDAQRLAGYLRRGRSSLGGAILAPGRWLLDGGR